MRFLMAFRLVATVALLFGLANLIFAFAPEWAVGTHMLLGILASFTALGVLWPLRSTGLGVGGMMLAIFLLVMGIGLRMGLWSGTATGLLHLAAGVGTIALVEMSAARAKRAGRRTR